MNCHEIPPPALPCKREAVAHEHRRTHLRPLRLLRGVGHVHLECLDTTEEHHREVNGVRLPCAVAGDCLGVLMSAVTFSGGGSRRSV